MRVVHILAALSHSGAERMLECSRRHWEAEGIDPIVIGMSDGPHAFRSSLIAAGYEVTTLPDMRSARGLAAHRRALRTMRPSIVHIHPERCFDLVAAVGSAGGAKGILRTVHSPFRFTGALRARRRLRVEVIRRAGVVWVACSSAVAEVERGYTPAGTCQVIENWADVERIAGQATGSEGSTTRNELEIGPAAKVLALIGNCGPAKNHQPIPAALREVAQPVHVLHIGDRKSASTAEMRAWAALDVRHTVHHLGHRDDIPALLAASDALAMPSLYEGMGIAAIEALSAGLPVVASQIDDFGWLDEIPTALTESHDPARWGAAIDRVLRKSAVDGRDVVADMVRRRFSPERGVRDYVAAYELAPATSRWPRSRCGIAR